MKTHKPNSEISFQAFDAAAPRFRHRVYDAVMERYIEGTLLDACGNWWILVNSKLTRFVDPERFFIEQCTGILDKTGQLIYEGDMIRWTGDPGAPSHIVAWNPRTCRWVLRLPKDINLENTASLCLGDAADNEYIIVGNIHQSATPSSAPSVPIRTNPYPSVSVRAANQEPRP